ncbi:MAG TPA: hypothetical protein VHP33_22695 [Polyangiaceae bacterium]|nr:hypothetical protein [Polyangiaceae bacterium]
MKRRVVARATWLLLASALTALAAGSPFSRVALLLPNCEQPGLNPGELREAVALDLRDEHLTLAPAGELSPSTDVLVRIEASCSAESELTVHAEFGDEHHSRRADLRELPPPQRARALSLAVAELLALFGQTPSIGSNQFPEEPAPPGAEGPAASAAQPAVPTAASATNPPPAPKPAAPSPPRNSPPHEAEVPHDRPTTRALPVEWRLSIAPELRFFDTSWLWGARALVHYGAWSAGVDLLRAHVSVPAGSVTTLVVHGNLAYSFELLRGQSSAFAVGPRLGFGRAFLTAQAASNAVAYDAQDVYFDAAFGARYSRSLSRAFRLGLAAELGYARGPIGYADDVEVANTSGAFAALFADASVRF